MIIFQQIPSNIWYPLVLGFLIDANTPDDRKDPTNEQWGQYKLKNGKYYIPQETLSLIKVQKGCNQGAHTRQKHIQYQNENRCNITCFWH
jgi:hypothetical protein